MRFILLAVLLAACDRPEPRAGIITEDNMAAMVPPGERAAGRPGDFYLKNALATFIVQRPVREVAADPYGGSLVDAALAGVPDRFGELVPVLAIGRTVRIDEMRVVSDGSDGGDAVVEGRGSDATNVYYNLKGIDPELPVYVPDGSGLLAHDPDVSLGLDVWVTYRLPLGEARLSVTYTFTNITGARVGVPMAFLVDSGGDLEAFQPGEGYESRLSKSFSTEDLTDLLTLDQSAGQVVYIGRDVAIGFVPRAVGERRPPRGISATVPGFGGVIMLEAENALSGFKESSFRLDPGERTHVSIDVVLAPTAAAVLTRGYELLGERLGEVTGCVKLTTGEPAPGMRVGLTAAGPHVAATFTTGADGCFAGRAPLGSYTAIAGLPYRPPSNEVAVEVPGHVELALAPLGAVEVAIDVYNTLAAASPTPHPCRVRFIGQRTLVAHPALGNLPIDDAGGLVARQAVLRTCRGRVELPPGRYLAMATRGPEFDLVENIVEVNAGGSVTWNGALHRVVDSDDYAASDFHVHSVYSSDSRVPADERVLSLAAEGMDFWASTDHDMVADFRPYLAALGLAGEMLTMPGAEVTTFDTGHFGAYPLPIDPFAANGGAPDWTAGVDGTRPTMQALFDLMRGRGALIQVNHPRGGGICMGCYFSRAGLRYDGFSGQPYADPLRQYVDSATLRFGPGVGYFSDDFDIIEVINGASTYVAGNMVYDRDAEAEGRDWMNFLAVGRRKTAVANSDTHDLARAPGVPRTMVGGHHSGLPGLLSALERGDAVMTTGPMLRAWLVNAAGETAGYGDLLSAAGSDRLTLHVRVETPTWYRADRLEILANMFFPDPDAGGEPTPLVPVMTLAPVEIVRSNGGRALVADAVVEIDMQAPPFYGRDSFIVVRAGGPQSTVFPVSGGGGVLDTSAATPATFLSNRGGVLPYAMANPILIDGEGDGQFWPAPPAL
ncbi:MAG: CehA/McbA family metallohydrolase [Deltaproteobacteria bacterium]|nr:CehA/McbA family metallohydrolase [Deltaproteobacteria bacterium]